jgi:hypothetical protein
VKRLESLATRSHFVRAVDWVINGRAIIRCPMGTRPNRLLSPEGKYRIARLAEKYGADILPCDLIDRIAFDSLRKSLPWERPPNQYDPRCKARYIDLEAISRPPRTCCL